MQDERRDPDDAPAESEAQDERRDPDDAPAEPSSQKRARRKPAGFRVAKDVRISTTSGFISVKAHHPIRDPHIIGHLKRSGIKLEPFYDD